MQKDNKKIKDIIVGYIDATKTGKVFSIEDKGIALKTIEKDKILELKPGIIGLFKPKKTTHFCLYKERTIIEKKLRPSIRKSMEDAFLSYNEKNEEKQKEKLAFFIVKGVNLIQNSTTLFVNSQYKKKQEDITYVKTIQIYREKKYSPFEMVTAFKQCLPEVFEAIKKIQAFPNSDMQLLFLTKEEEALMTMLKTKWEIIPIKNTKIVQSILEKIEADEEIK